MRDKRVARPWWVAPAACLATVLALPVNAGIVVPTEPLTTGARVPPNVLFVLDNSGSMSETRLPDSIPNVSTINIKNQTFIRNKIYYNPYKVYLPWVDSTGATMNGGRNYNDAYSGTDRIPPFDNSTTNLQTSTQSYYVPKDPVDTAAHGNVSGYYRYQILTSGAVQRSEWDASRSEAVVAPGYPVGGLSGTGTRKRLAYGAFWGGVAFVLSRGVTLLVSFLLARLLGREGFGEYGMVNATSGMIGGMAGLGISFRPFVA